MSKIIILTKSREKIRNNIYRYTSWYIAINSFPITNFAGNIVIKQSFARIICVIELHTREMQSNFSDITKLYVFELIFPAIYNASKQTLRSEFSPDSRN